MAGRPKQGIDYSGWSVDIFDSDAKIDKLLDAKGWKGFGIYFFLCQRAYKTNGYFTNGVMTTVQQPRGRWAAASIPGQWRKLSGSVFKWIFLIKGYLTDGASLQAEVSNAVSGRFCLNGGAKLYMTNTGC